MKTWQKVAIGGIAVTTATYLLWRLWGKKDENGGMTTDEFGNGYMPTTPVERAPGSGTPIAPWAGVGGEPGMPQGMDLTPGDLSTPLGVPGTDMQPMNPALLTNQSALPNTLAGGSPTPIVAFPSRPISRRGGSPCPPGMYWNDAVGGCMNE